MDFEESLPLLGSSATMALPRPGISGSARLPRSSKTFSAASVSAGMSGEASSDGQRVSRIESVDISPIKVSTRPSIDVNTATNNILQQEDLTNTDSAGMSRRRYAYSNGNSAGNGDLGADV